MLTSLSLSSEYVIMDKAYEGDETRQTVRDLGLTPVVPPKRKGGGTITLQNFNEADLMDAHFMFSQDNSATAA